MMPVMPHDGVSLQLTRDEALVLFELLHRWEDDNQVIAPQRPVEQVALWNLSALLERELNGPLDPQYAELVSEASARVSPRDL